MSQLVNKIIGQNKIVRQILFHNVARMQKLILGLAILVFISSCCKVEVNMREIRNVQFSNFLISEIDTFYSLPVYNDSILPFSAYSQYLETTQSLNCQLQKNLLGPFSNLEIVLKDTSKRYRISDIIIKSERLGNKRCSPEEISIDSFKVNGVYQNEQAIKIVK
jgi:hypothetical protein